MSEFATVCQAHLRIFEPTIIFNRFIIDYEKIQTHVLLQDISIILVQVFCKKAFLIMKSGPVNIHFG